MALLALDGEHGVLRASTRPAVLRLRRHAAQAGDETERRDDVPRAKEELLGHTSKALSLHALTSLGVADRVLFLDARLLCRNRNFTAHSRRHPRHRRDACSMAWRFLHPTHWLISPQADIWIARHVPLRAFLEAAGAADVALPAPCYRQLFGAAVVLVRSTPWAAGFLATWFGLRCGPKDQPSLWHLVLRAAGLDVPPKRC